MKNVEKWIRSGGATAPAFLVMAALAAFVVFAVAPAARAQGPGPDGPAIVEVDGDDDFGAEFDDGPLAMGGMHEMHGMDGMSGGRGGMGHGMGRGMHGGMGGRHAEMMEKLKLTPQQKEKMADLRDAQQRKMIGIRGGLAEARLDMRKLMRADVPSQAQIDATIDRMAKLRADAQKSRIATHLAMRGLLTDSQRKTMDEMRGGMRGMGGGMHDGSGSGPHGGGKKGA